LVVGRIMNNLSALVSIQKLVFDKCGFEYTPALAEDESAEYGAHTFQLNGLAIRFRTSKITPTKVGQFVTLWKRNGNGPIQPFDLTDPVDLFIISVRKDNHFGQFVFPKSVLCKQGVVSNTDKGGKRAIRVYPPWDKTTSSQAKKTQQWQLNYFLEIPENKTIDIVRAKMLYRPE
jgi:hypothetical protein